MEFKGTETCSHVMTRKGTSLKISVFEQKTTTHFATAAPPIYAINVPSPYPSMFTCVFMCGNFHIMSINVPALVLVLSHSTHTHSIHYMLGQDCNATTKSQASICFCASHTSYALHHNYQVSLHFDALNNNQSHVVMIPSLCKYRIELSHEGFKPLKHPWEPRAVLVGRGRSPRPISTAQGFPRVFNKALMRGFYPT